jgi:hypothetical protein
LKINGKEVDPDSQAAKDFFLDEKNEKLEKTVISKGKKFLVTRQGWKEMVAELKEPFRLEFKGYDGFIGPKEMDKSDESKETFGLTLFPSQRLGGDSDDIKEMDRVKYSPNRIITIKFKKELYINRLGHNQLIKKLEKNGSQTYHDICFEEVVGTIAHELAHAIVMTMESEYDGEAGGGHGKL